MNGQRTESHSDSDTYPDFGTASCRRSRHLSDAGGDDHDAEYAPCVQEHRWHAADGEGHLIQFAEPVKELAEHLGQNLDWAGITALPTAEFRSTAEAYAHLPSEEASDQVRRAWHCASMAVSEQFNVLIGELGVRVRFTGQNPYRDFHEMHETYQRTGELRVLATAVTGAHPIWAHHINDKFRAVHDAFGHLATGRGFDIHGEEAALQAHLTMFPQEAHSALITECRGQNAFRWMTKRYAQKIGFLPTSIS